MRQNFTDILYSKYRHNQLPVPQHTGHSWRLFGLGVITALLTFIFTTPAAIAAKDVPVPARKTDALKGLQIHMDTQKQNKAQMETQLRDTEKSLTDTQKKLRIISAEIQSHEKDLLKIEKNISGLTAQRQQLNDNIDEERYKMADFILARQRLDRMPTELLVLRPASPIETAQTALLLQGSLPVIQDNINGYSNDLKKLERIEDELITSKQVEKSLHKDLLSKKDEIKTLMRTKEEQYEKIESDIKITSVSLDRMAKESQNLEELLKKLSAQEKKRKANRPKGTKVAAVAMPTLGQPQPPIQGLILTGFNKKNNIGAISQGITIEGHSGGLVVAPMGGVVKFASYFKNYGQLVLISHKGEYFSLIAGMEDINTKAGRAIKAGEPIGTLPVRSSREVNPTLYYELRLKGKPIDPGRKLSALKS